MHAVGEWILVFVLAASVFAPASSRAASPGTEAPSTSSAIPMLASSTLQLTGPTSCPSSGCAIGQRIGMKYEFDLTGTTLADDTNANVRVCLYATSFQSGSAPTASSSEINGRPYSSISNPTDCPAAPPNFTPLAGLQATLALGTLNDALRFAYRLGNSASGQVRAELYARTASGWGPVTSAFSPTLNIDSSSASQAYVAKDAPACASNTPCFINSYGDEAGGIGTGLKDAIDAGKTDILVLGTYPINANTVQVNRALQINGVGNAKITYLGANNASLCAANPMLEFSEAVILRNLTIDDGNCSGTNSNRDLIRVNSTLNGTRVTIESNDLTGGNNAISVSSANVAYILVRFNNITSNAGRAIAFDANGDTRLDATANNLHNNSAVPPADCKANANTRKVDHNYWGAGAPANTNCILNPAKRLGAPIVHNTSAPGVRAHEVEVTPGRSDAFDNQVGYHHTGVDANNFNMYIVDHGYAVTSGPPFSGLLNGESPSPCSNAWDVFLADGVSVASGVKLDLIFKYYDKEGETPGCLAVINSTKYCDQNDTPENYPLFWLDPSASSATKWWDLAGLRPENITSTSVDGQDTTCNIPSNEIQVSLDNDSNHRPNLTDLGYTPFMVGIPVIKSFKPYASSQSVRVDWSTNVEPDIKGFFLLRGTDPNNLTPINGDIITRTGTSSTGASYSRTDSGRVNTVTYYYRLQVVRTDGYSFYSQIESITVNAATPIPPTATWTATMIRPTNTLGFTPVPTQNPTPLQGKTSTPSKTKTPTPTFMVLPTLTPTLNLLTPGALETQDALNSTQTAQWIENGASGMDGTMEPGQADGTEIALAGSTTPTLDSTVAAAEAIIVPKTGSKMVPWLSLLLGLLAGLAVVGGAGGWWYYAAKK